MNEHKNTVSLPENQAKDGLYKLPYATPRLEKVRLFADQVLGSCRLDPPCVTIHPIATVS